MTRREIRENGAFCYAALGKVDFFGEQAMIVVPGPGLHRSRHEILTPNCGMTYILVPCTSSLFRSQ
jgi:hypothetical protein